MTVGPITSRPTLAVGRIPLLVPLLAILVALAGLIAWSRHDDGPTGPSRVAFATPVPNSREVLVPVRLLLLVDESGSTGASDPHQNRWTEAQAFVKAWARFPENTHDRLAIGRFASTVDIGPTLDPRHDRAALLAATQGTGPDVGASGTDLVAALQAADVWCANTNGDAAVVTVISDGQVSDVGAVADTVNASRCDQLNLVGLNGDRIFGNALQGQYADMAWAHIWRVDTPAPGTFAATLIESLTTATGQQPPPGGWITLTQEAPSDDEAA